MRNWAAGEEAMKVEGDGGDGHGFPSCLGMASSRSAASGRSRQVEGGGTRESYGLLTSFQPISCHLLLQASAFSLGHLRQRRRTRPYRLRRSKFPNKQVTKLSRNLAQKLENGKLSEFMTLLLEFALALLTVEEGSV